jgi:hypothetical protein
MVVADWGQIRYILAMSEALLQLSKRYFITK